MKRGRTSRYPKLLLGSTDVHGWYYDEPGGLAIYCYGVGYVGLIPKRYILRYLARLGYKVTKVRRG